MSRSGSEFFKKPFWARADATGEDGQLSSSDGASKRAVPLNVSEPAVRSKPVSPAHSAPASGFMTTQEAAHYVRLSPRTLERLRTDGTGPRYRKAGPGKKARVLYLKSDLDAWLEKSFGSTSEYE